MIWLGLTTATVLTIPTTVQAQSFNFDRLEFIEARPLRANGTLSFFGDQNQNEGYAAYSNLDRNAPDAGHIGFRSDLNSRYYVTGREHSPDPTGATRSATLTSLTDFPNLMSYLDNNNISFNDIGFGFGQKEGFSITQTLNLGEDMFGQDWFGSPDSPVEESIYRASSNEFEYYLLYQNTKIVNLGYSDTFFASADDNPGSVFGNPNIFFTNPTSPVKFSNLDGLASGIADAFLQDVSVRGGKIQQVSEDILDLEDFSASVNQGFEIFTFSFPIELRIVGTPEPSSIFALILVAGGGIVSGIRQHQKKQ
jgi:hypothetical protein